MIPCFLIIAHNTGGVVTLDPCDHLCSLDGVQVTVPTPLTQGKIDHAHTKKKLDYPNRLGPEVLVYCHLLIMDDIV